MKADLNQKVIGIYGPTISKKTGLAVNIAKYVWGKYDLEPVLISADPRKLYKELTVVPVAITPPFDKKIKVRMFRILDSLNQEFSLYDYKTQVDEIIREAHQKGKLPVIYGGSAIYISAVLENWSIPKDWEEGIDYKKQYGKSKPRYQSIVLIPDTSKKTLSKWINTHTKKNINSGLVEELIKLTKKYDINPLSKPTDNLLYKSLEYRQVLEYCFENQKPLNDLDNDDLSKIQKTSAKALRDYARRQKAWIPKIETEKHLVSGWQEAREIVDAFLKK